MTQIISSLFVLSLFFTGCADSLKTDPEGGDRTEGLNPDESLVDASKEHWVYFSFGKRDVVEVANAAENRQWDLGFQRFQIKVNGGVSGPGEVEIAVVEQPYDDVNSFPDSVTFATDKEGTDPLNDPGLAFLALGEGWYNYNPADHSVTPKERVYLIDNGLLVYKLQILSYYDAVGTPAQIKFRWSGLDGAI